MSEESTEVRAMWRAAEQEWSRAAFEQWEHSRRLADVARACMHRGDQVTFAFDAFVWTGKVDAVGDDIARVRSGPSTIDVRLASDAPFVLRSRPAGFTGSLGESLTTFAARLRELDGTRVWIGTAADRLEGVLRVGHDHLRVAADDGPAYVPRASVWWVRALGAD